MANKPQQYTKSDYERADNDFYIEPSWCVEALADAIPFDGTIYDPACGTGTIPEVFAQRGFDVVASDIVDRGYPGATVMDFLTATGSLPNGINIVTNPPFDHAEAFVRKGLSLPGVNRVCIIQQTRFLNSRGRYKLFTEFPPTDVLILSRRPSMPPGHLLAEMTANGTAFKGGAIDYAWICHRRGHTGETRLRWLNPS